MQFFFDENTQILFQNSSQPGFEPGTLGVEVQRAIHCATGTWYDRGSQLTWIGAIISSSRASGFGVEPLILVADLFQAFNNFLLVTSAFDGFMIQTLPERRPETSLICKKQFCMLKQCRTELSQPFLALLK